MANRQINLVITGNNRGAIRAIDQVGVSASRAAKMSDQAFGQSTSRVGSMFKKLDTQLGQFGVPFAGALGAVGTKLEETGRKSKTLEGRLSTLGGAIALGAAAGIAVIGKSAVQAAIEGEQSHAQLVKAVENTGHAYDQYADKVDGASRKLADYGFENDQVETSIATLTRVTKDAGRATDLMGLAADIARAKGMDLASATNILVAVEAGRYTILRRQLGLTAEQVKGIKSESDAVKLLSSIYGGAAAASAETFGGKIAALQAKTKNLEEELGARLIPVVEGTVSGLLGAVRGFEAANGATDGWLGKLAVAGTILPVTVFAVDKLGAGVRALGGLFVKAESATALYGTAAAGAAAKTSLVASAESEAAIATAGQVTADNALVAAKARLLVAQTAEAAAIDKLVVAQEAYIAASTAAAANPADVAAATSLGKASTKLEGAQRRVEQTAGRAAIAQAELGALTAETAVKTGMAAKAAAFFGQEMTLAGSAGIAAAGGLISYQLAMVALQKLFPVVTPDVQGLSKSFVTLANDGRLSGEVARRFGQDLTGLNKTISVMGKSNLSRLLADPLKFGQEGKQAQTNFDAINKSLEDVLGSQGAAAASEAFGQFSLQLIKSGQSAADVEMLLGPFIDKINDAVDSMSPAERATYALDRATLAYQRDVAGGEATRGRLAQDLADLKTASAANTVEQAKLADAQRGVADASTMSADALKALSEATGISAAKLAAGLHLTDAQAKILSDDIKNLKDSFGKSFESAATVVGDFGKKTHLTFADVRAEYQKNIEATSNWARNLQVLAEAGLNRGLLAQLAAAGPKAAAEVQAIADGIKSGSIRSLNDLTVWGNAVAANTDRALAQAGINARVRSGEISAAVRNIPDQVNIDLMLQAIPGAGTVRLGDGTIGVQTSIVTFTAPSAIPGRAVGGPVRSDMPYVVGERGPELFVPNQAGTIIPNGTSSQPRPTASGTTIPIIIELDGKQIANTVVKHSDRVGGLPIRIRTAS